MPEIQDNYAALVTLLRDLGEALRPAVAAMYDAPPRRRVSADPVSTSNGVPNPTLDVVMDPRRAAVSDAVSRSCSALRQARLLLDSHPEALRKATARWEGQDDPQH